MMAKPPEKKRQTNLELANEMFKAAFAVIRQRFAAQMPGASTEDLDRKTAEYFRQLNLEKK